MKAKFIMDIDDEKYSMSIFQCECGFHLGLDFTYLDQCGDIQIKCPSCGEVFDTDYVR